MLRTSIKLQLRESHVAMVDEFEKNNHQLMLTTYKNILFLIVAKDKRLVEVYQISKPLHAYLKMDSRVKEIILINGDEFFGS